MSRVQFHLVLRFFVALSIAGLIIDAFRSKADAALHKQIWLTFNCATVSSVNNHRRSVDGDSWSPLHRQCAWHSGLDGWRIGRPAGAINCDFNERTNANLLPLDVWLITYARTTYDELQLVWWRVALFMKLYQAHPPFNFILWKHMYAMFYVAKSIYSTIVHELDFFLNESLLFCTFFLLKFVVI